MSVGVLIRGPLFWYALIWGGQTAVLSTRGACQIRSFFCFNALKCGGKRRGGGGRGEGAQQRSAFPRNLRNTGLMYPKP